MNDLPIELIIYILEWFDLKSQIRFIFASTDNQFLIKYWKIKNQIFINEKILKLSYYDCFINIIIHELLQIYPKKLRYLTINCGCKRSIFDSVSNQPSLWQNPISKKLDRSYIIIYKIFKI